MVYLPTIAKVMTGREAIQAGINLGCRGVDGVTEDTALCLSTGPKSGLFFCTRARGQAQQIGHRIHEAVAKCPRSAQEYHVMALRIQSWRRSRPLRLQRLQVRVQQLVKSKTSTGTSVRVLYSD